MHDTDRTMGRTNMEFGFQGEGNMNEFYAEMENGEFQGEQPLLHEEELNEMAAELLSVTNDRELEQFLGDVFKKVGSAVGSFVRSPIGQQMGGMLKGVAKQALPMVGQAVGNYFAPGVGGAIGQQVGSAAGQVFGLELEGLSNEDRDFEVAKQFVRLAADAAQTAAHAPANQNPAAIAQHAIADAAQRYAPGLLNTAGAHTNGASNGAHTNGAYTNGHTNGAPAFATPGFGTQNGTTPSGGANSGRWVRKGQKLIVYGL
jgi:hypothetical protein